MIILAKRLTVLIPLVTLFCATPALATTIVSSAPCASPLAGTLAGVTKAPGSYCLSAEAKTGTLTLDAQGDANAVWNFQIDGGLTGTNFHVVMAGGGQPCNVNWLATAATMTDSDLKGIIHADSTITLTRGTLVGQALAPHVTNTGAKVTDCKASSSVTAAASAASAAPAAAAAGSANSGGSTLWPWLIGLLVAVVAAILIGYAIRRRRAPKTP
jgi:Ice-binding-like